MSSTGVRPKPVKVQPSRAREPSTCGTRPSSSACQSSMIASGTGLAGAVVHRAVQPDRSRVARRDQRLAAGEGEGVAEERADGLAGRGCEAAHAVSSSVSSNGVRWLPVSTMSQL